MEDFVRAIGREELAVGEMKLVEVSERLVILFRADQNRFCCIDDVCTHDGGTLSDGRQVGREIICPRHGARFDMCSGKALCMPATQDTVAHDVKVDGDTVFVRIKSAW